MQYAVPRTNTRTAFPSPAEAGPQLALPCCCWGLLPLVHCNGHLANYDGSLYRSLAIPNRRSIYNFRRHPPSMLYHNGNIRCEYQPLYLRGALGVFIFYTHLFLRCTVATPAISVLKNIIIRAPRAPCSTMEVPAGI